MRASFSSLRTLLVLSAAAGLAGCGGSPSAAADPSPGWLSHDPRDQTVAPTLLPAAEALAWRFDTDEGPLIQIWLSGQALTAEQRERLRPWRPREVTDKTWSPEALGIPGLLLQLEDDGDTYRKMVVAYHRQPDGSILSQHRGLGVPVVLFQLDAERVRGAHFSSAGDGLTAYRADFEATIRNESTAPFPGDVAWSADGGAAGVDWEAAQAAIALGDFDSAKRYTLPERRAELDSPAAREMITRSQPEAVEILSGVIHGDSARLFVRGQFADPPLVPAVMIVELRLVDGVWMEIERRL